MKFLLPFNILLIFLALLNPTHILAAEIVSEVDINTAVASNWFTPNLSEMPNGTTHYAFRSPSNNADIGYSVYLPPDYETNTTQTYPVMYWLHGAGGNELQSLWLATLVDDAIKANKIQPMIVVFPNAGGRTMWCDSFDGAVLSETMFIDELIPLIDSKFRTIPNRSGRFLEGFSMGGFGSAKFLFRYPAKFSSAVTYGGAYDTEEWVISTREFSEAFGSNIEYFTKNNPYTVAQQYVDSAAIDQFPVRIRTVVGTLDLAYDLNTSFKSLLTTLPVSWQYMEISGLDHTAEPYYETAGIEGFNFHF